MTTKLALCPDGVTRAYSVEDGVAVVDVRGYRVEGKVTVEDGITKFRQSAQHHGSHLVYYRHYPTWQRGVQGPMRRP